MNASRDGNMRRRRRPQLHYEVCLVPSREGVPPGDATPYRYMDEAEREAVLLDCLLRILRESTEREPAQSGPSPRSEPP
ncbi:MAG: hypothetical protein ACK44W_10575 [Planctomycetota bacterium]